MKQYFIYTNALPNEINEEVIIASLPISVLEHCKRYGNKSSYLQSIYSWKCLIDKLESEYGYVANEDSFDFSKSKPSLNDTNLHFNISHSNNAIALIIDTSECGIDIQKEFTSDLVSKKILNEEEKREYENSLNKKEYLNYKWVMKEAYGKCLGVGINSKILDTNVTTNNKKTIRINDDSYYLSWFVKER